MKIAIIEDDKILNLAIKNVLKGHNVTQFFDTNVNGEFDLWIIDINLSNENGLDILPFLNGKKIVITASIDLNHIKKAYKNGADDFIRKPFFPEELLYKIEKLFPKTITIKNHILDVKKQTFNNIKLSKKETLFLTLFQNKDFATFEEIKEKIDKTDNSLYIFISRLKKKIPLNFENIKGEGYIVKEK
jgi:DNA-binding response OmpR family regulator